MNRQSVNLTGSTFTLSVAQLGEQTISNLATSLADKMAAAPQFFRFAPLVIDLEQSTAAVDIQKIAETVKQQGFTLAGFSSVHSSLKEQVNQAGIPVLSHLNQKQKIEQQASPALSPMVIQKQIRSGQQIYAANRDLIIIGNVSNAAEVIADGDIHIYGTLRGRALAGASGNEQARIYCQNISAELISIAGNYLLHDSIMQQINSPAQSAYIEQSSIKFSPLGG